MHSFLQIIVSQLPLFLFITIVLHIYSFKSDTQRNRCTLFVWLTVTAQQGSALWLGAVAMAPSSWTFRSSWIESDTHSHSCACCVSKRSLLLLHNTNREKMRGALGRKDEQLAKLYERSKLCLSEQKGTAEWWAASQLWIMIYGGIMELFGLCVCPSLWP